MQLNIDSRLKPQPRRRSRGCLSPFGCDTCLVGPKLLSISLPSPRAPILASSGGTCPVSMCTTVSLFSLLTCNSADLQHTNNGGLWGSSPPRRTAASQPGVTVGQETASLLPQLNLVLSRSTHGCKSQFIFTQPFFHVKTTTTKKMI